MKSIVSAKKKPARRYLSNIWGDPKSPLNRREYAPGQHGQRRKNRPTTVNSCMPNRS